MRGGRGGGGGGGGGRPQPLATGEGAEIPLASRKLVQGLKGILADRTEAEIYATLLDCAMDPDVAVERLISQDPFHEVRRKRNNKKEIKPSQETRSRPFFKPAYRGSKSGPDRSGRSYSGLGDSTGSAKGSIKIEPEILSTPNSSTSDSLKAETISAAGNTADVKSAAFQPPTQMHHGWVGVPGRPSMADIVKMGRPHANSGSRSVVNSAGVPAVGGPVISSAANHTLKDYENTVLPSEADRVMDDELPNGTIQVHSAPKDDSSVDILLPVEGSDVPDSFDAAMNANAIAPFTLDANKDGMANDHNLEETEENANNANGLSSSEPVSVSDKNIPLNNDLIEKTDDYQSDEHSVEHQQNSSGDMSTTAYQFGLLSTHEENKPEDNPAVIIPGHLQVSNADFAHLTFGSFVSGTLDTSCFTKPANSDGEFAPVSDNHSSDQSDARSHGYENKETSTPEANEYNASATNSNMENPNIMSTPAQQSEVGRTDVMDVTNSAEYNLSSPSDYTTPGAGQPDSAAQTYLQENRQTQNISPLSSFMQANMPNGLLPPAMPSFRELDPAFSLLLTNPPLATMMHGMPPSSMSNATVPTQPQENVNQGGLSNPQLTHTQASTSIAPGPPLPHHLALHPYAQATLPLGYANMIGYPSLAQSYAYLPPAAFQQPYMNSGLFHQPAAAAPNSSIKYPMPQYKTNVPLGNMPQPASMLSSYVGGYGTANFAMNQSTGSSTATLGFDGTMPTQYKDGNQYISLQQNENHNPAMWMHGAGSRAMPPLTTSTLYGYQGQQGHQGGLRQGQPPSQFGAALGQSQAGLGPEHRNPSDSNLSAAGQANQMWPNSY